MDEENRIERLSESYSDTFNKHNRAGTRDAYIEGYKQACEDEGYFIEDLQRKLSNCYSNLKCDLHNLRQSIRYKERDKGERMKKYLELKEEFEGVVNSY